MRVFHFDGAEVVSKGTNDCQLRGSTQACVPPMISSSKHFRGD